MCYRLPADCLITNHFLFHQSHYAVSLRQLQDEAYAIIAICQNGILADVSYQDFEYAVASNREFFEMVDHELRLKKEHMPDYLKLKASIARKMLPLHVRSAMEKVLSEKPVAVI